MASFFHKQVFFILFQLNNSSYNYDISSQNIPAEAFVLSHKINSTGFKADFNWFLGRNEINFGLDLNKYAIVSRKLSSIQAIHHLLYPHTIEKERAWEGALYIDDKFLLTDYSVS